jgi:hypothetical protein
MPREQRQPNDGSDDEGEDVEKDLLKVVAVWRGPKAAEYGQCFIIIAYIAYCSNGEFAMSFSNWRRVIDKNL